MINSRKDLENYIRADRQRNIGSIGFLKYRLGLFMKSESCIAFHYLTAETLRILPQYTSESLAPATGLLLENPTFPSRR